MPKRHYFEHLDLVRVFFVFIVLLHHWIAENPFALLPFGSTIAFVLSSFLLTGPLLKNKENESTYWHTTGRFLARRLLRTLPVYLLVLCVYLIVNRYNFRQYLGYFLTFTQNYVIAYNQDSINNPVEYIQTWSLAIQEQFYLLLPLLLYSIPVRYSKYFFILLAIGGLAVRLLYFYLELPFTYNHFTTECCIDCFGIGALISYYHYKEPDKLKSILKNKKLLLALIVLYLSSTLGYFNTSENALDHNYFSLYNNLYRITERTFVSLFSVWFIAWGIYFPSKKLTQISTNPIIVYLSKISYGIYIYHLLIASAILKFIHVFTFDVSRFEWWLVCLNFIATIAVSAVSYELIEKPILRLKDKYFGDPAKAIKLKEHNLLH
ncbi:acyltransferase family protein [Runella sp.]|uniref:acyltransferase family protein n=1 Tax=Runella sp. TaxID=1960881 RepID=UPI003D0F8EF2